MMLRSQSSLLRGLRRQLSTSPRVSKPVLASPATTDLLPWSNEHSVSGTTHDILSHAAWRTPSVDPEVQMKEYEVEIVENADIEVESCPTAALSWSAANKLISEYGPSDSVSETADTADAIASTGKFKNRSELIASQIPVENYFDHYRRRITTRSTTTVTEESTDIGGKDVDIY